MGRGSRVLHILTHVLFKATVLCVLGSFLSYNNSPMIYELKSFNLALHALIYIGEAEFQTASLTHSSHLQG